MTTGNKSTSAAAGSASGSTANAPVPARVGGLFAQAQLSSVLDVSAWPVASFSVDQAIEEEQQRGAAMAVVDIRSVQVGNLLVPVRFDDACGPVAPGSSVSLLVENYAFLSVTSTSGDVVGVEVTIALSNPPSTQHAELARYNKLGAKFILNKSAQTKVAVLTVFGMDLLGQLDHNLRSGPAARFGKNAPHCDLVDAITGMFSSPKPGGGVVPRLRLEGFEVESMDGRIYKCSTKSAGQDRLVDLAGGVRVMTEARVVTMIKNLKFDGAHFRERLEYYSQEHSALPVGHEMKSAGALPQLEHLPILQAANSLIFEEFVHVRMHAHNQVKLGWQDFGEGSWSHLKDESTMEGKKRLHSMVERFQEVAAMVWNEVFVDVAESVGRAYKDKSYPFRRFHDGMASVLLWGVIATWSHDLHNSMVSSVSGASLHSPLLAKQALQAGFEAAMAHMYKGTGPWIVSPSEDYYLHGGVAARLVYRSTTRDKRPMKSALKKSKGKVLSDSSTVASGTSLSSADVRKVSTKRKRAGKKSAKAKTGKPKKVRLQEADSEAESMPSRSSGESSDSTASKARERLVIKTTALNAKIRGTSKLPKAPVAPAAGAAKSVCLFWLAAQLSLKDEDGEIMTCNREAKGLPCYGRHDDKGLKGVTAKECLGRVEKARISEEKKAIFVAGIEAAKTAGTIK